jgi:hypothetical protein
MSAYDRAGFGGPLSAPVHAPVQDVKHLHIQRTSGRPTKTNPTHRPAREVIFNTGPSLNGAVTDRRSSLPCSSCADGLTDDVCSDGSGDVDGAPITPRDEWKFGAGKQQMVGIDRHASLVESSSEIRRWPKPFDVQDQFVNCVDHIRIDRFEPVSEADVGRVRSKLSNRTRTQKSDAGVVPQRVEK